MTESLSTRVRRVYDSFVHDSALRSVIFLSADFFQPKSAQIETSTARIEGDYASDADAISELSRAHRVTPVVFQTWKSRSVIPANFRYWRNTFVEHNPGWRILLWDDDDNRAFIKERFSWFLPRFDSYPREIFRADIVRLFFLFEFGGFYADMDTECLQSVTETANAGDVVLCRMGANTDFSHSIPNAIMASRPWQAFWLFVISKAICVIDSAASQDEIDALGPETATGPQLLKRCYDEFSKLSQDEIKGEISDVVSELTDDQRARIQYGRVRILPPKDWYPLDWTNLWHKQICTRMRKQQRVLPFETVQRLFPDATTITYWNHSW